MIEEIDQCIILDYGRTQYMDQDVYWWFPFSSNYSIHKIHKDKIDPWYENIKNELKSIDDNLLIYEISGKLLADFLLRFG